MGWGERTWVESVDSKVLIYDTYLELSRTDRTVIIKIMYVFIIIIIGFYNIT
jgi:hypothetical protein